MPSSALLKFESYCLVEVDHIIDTHAMLHHDGDGRRGLGHITRNGVLMLCAAWELYVEELGQEVARYLADRALSPGDLPLKVQKTIAEHVSKSKHILKPLELAGDGWELVYLSYVDQCFGGLNTPKAGPVEKLYSELLGWEDCASNWSCGKDAINDFVKARGDIAHRGRDTQYVKIRDLCAYRETIVLTAQEHDNAAADFVRDNSEGRSPWNRRAI